MLQCSPRISRIVYVALKQRPLVTTRSFLTWPWKDKGKGSQADPSLSDEALFQPLSNSPFQDLQARSQTIKHLCKCPVCLGQVGSASQSEENEPSSGQTRLVAFDCPKCGYPTHCSEEHWKEDTGHDQYCPKLKEVNEDEHDLRRNRQMMEYKLPTVQPYEEAISFSNWDLFWYTRGFQSMDTEQMRRHASKLLTYPLTLGSILHRHSYITTNNSRLTTEGARSLAALRTTLHAPVGGPETSQSSIGKPPTRIFVLGARAESALPPHVWAQLCHLFPAAVFQIYFIGPQVALPKEATTPLEPEQNQNGMGNSETNSAGKVEPNEDVKATKLYEIPTPRYIGSSSSKRRMRALTVSSGIPSYTLPHSPYLTLTALRSQYTQAIHDELGPFDPYTDMFVLYAPGFGFPSPTMPNTLQISSPAEWGGVLSMLLSTRCPIFLTAFSPTDLKRDIQAVEQTEGIADEFDWIITPGKNEFGSEKWEVADFDLRVMVKLNWAVWGIRGKTREVRERTSWWPLS